MSRTEPHSVSHHVSQLYHSQDNWEWLGVYCSRCDVSDSWRLIISSRLLPTSNHIASLRGLGCLLTPGCPVTSNDKLAESCSANTGLGARGFPQKHELQLVLRAKPFERNISEEFLWTYRAGPAPLSPHVLLPRAPTTKSSTSSCDTPRALALLWSPWVINPWV